MPDPLRTTPISEAKAASGDTDAEREAKIESLLLAGLDQYFAREYSQAIDIWSRALFLDRSHARARAYIERARSAMAEAQRESEELLHNGIAAFERGEIATARDLLNAAVHRGGAHDVALAFLTRIDRISAAAQAPHVPSSAPQHQQHRPARRRPVRRRAPWGPVVLLAGLGAAAASIASWGELRALIPVLSNDTHGDFAPLRPAQEPLILPRSAETAMERARTLHAAGRPYDALRAVDLVRPTDPLRAEADRLKAVIQRDLLAHQTTPGAVTSARPQ